MELNELIARAVSIAGSAYKLAPQLDVTQQQISDWKHGRKKPSIEQLADLALAANVSVKEVLVQEAINRAAGTPRGKRLQRALGKAHVGLLETLAIFGVSVAALHAANGDLRTWLATMYIM